MQVQTDEKKEVDYNQRNDASCMDGNEEIMPNLEGKMNLTKDESGRFILNMPLVISWMRDMIAPKAFEVAKEFHLKCSESLKKWKEEMQPTSLADINTKFLEIWRGESGNSSIGLY